MMALCVGRMGLPAGQFQASTEARGGPRREWHQMLISEVSPGASDQLFGRNYQAAAPGNGYFETRRAVPPEHLPWLRSARSGRGFFIAAK